MAERNVSVTVTGKVQSFVRAMDEAGVKAEATAGKMSKSFEHSTSRIGGLFSGLGNQAAAFGLPLQGVLDHVGAKFDAAKAKGEGLHSQLSALGGVTTVATAAALGGIAVESIHLADAYEKAHAQLENSLKNTGQAFEKVKPAIEAADKQGEKFGYTMTETEATLAQSEVAFGNTKKATNALTLAQNLSAKTHRDLSSSMLLVIKGMEGQIGPLKRAGIDLPIATGGALKLKTAQDALAKAQENEVLVQRKVADGQIKAKDAAAALAAAHDKVTAAQQKVNDAGNAGNRIYDAMSAKFKGAAAASADTFAGKMKTVSAQFEDMGIKIGVVLIPIVEKLMGALGDTVGFLEHNKAAMIAVAAIAIPLLGGAIAIFVSDKIAAFVNGLERVLSRLGLLKTQAEETATAVEASGATMAESSAVGGVGAAGAGAAGAGAAAGEAEAGAGAEGAAAAEGTASFGATAAAVAVPLALLGGVAYGLGKTFGFVKDESIQVHFSLGNMASQSVPQLADKFTVLSHSGQVMDRVLHDNASSTLATKTMHQEFNKVLSQSPQFAQKYIDAVQRAGGSTEWFTKQLGKHMVASEESSIATQRFTLKQQIMDAQVRGNTGAVYGLTLQLNALPTDKQIEIAAHTQQAFADVIAFRDAVDSINRDVTVAVNVIGAAPGRALFGP